MPKRHFGDGDLLEVFYKTMASCAPGAWSLNEALIQLWQPGALSHAWALPDNHHIDVKVMSPVTEYVQFMDRPVAVHINVNQGTDEGLSLGANITHSIDGLVVREMHRRCDFNPQHLANILKMIKDGTSGSDAMSISRQKDRMVLKLWERFQDSGFLSGRILDMLDEKNIGHVNAGKIRKLILSMPAKPFPVISIHDCFRVHPNYGNDLRKQYNQIMSEIAESEMLQSIVSQIIGSHTPVTKMGDISQEVLQAEYALS